MTDAEVDTGAPVSFDKYYSIGLYLSWLKNRVALLLLPRVVKDYSSISLHAVRFDNTILRRSYLWFLILGNFLTLSRRAIYFPYSKSGRNTTNTGSMLTPTKTTRQRPSSFVPSPDPTWEPSTCRGGDFSLPSSSGSLLPPFYRKFRLTSAWPSRKSGLLQLSVSPEPSWCDSSSDLRVTNTVPAFLWLSFCALPPSLLPLPEP